MTNPSPITAMLVRIHAERALPTATRAQKSARVDFAIPSLGLIIEVKYVRSGTQSAFADVINEIAADTGLYLSLPAVFSAI